MNTLCLNKWKIKPVSGSDSVIPADISFPNHLDVNVPGDIYMHLTEANLIKDPFYADNELKLAWIAQCDWEYTCNFVADDNSDFDTLVCEGLDTVAEIYFNDLLIARAENMFVRYVFDIKNYLRKGSNDIRIILRSPLKEAIKRKSAIRQLPSARHKNRVFIRKAQYSFGWDWGPAFPSSGIWKDIYLKKSSPEVDHIAFETISIKSNKATVRTTVALNDIHEELFLTVRIFDKEQDFEQQMTVSNTQSVSCQIEINDAKLWWPHDQGLPYLYDLEITIRNSANESVAVYQKKVGIRIGELKLKEKDKNCFKFNINGKDIYLKGANWIPADSFLPRVKKEKYKELLQSAQNANMNVLRVWGGGIYEDDYFYEQCDSMGILVWQDFMFACATYPDTNVFLNNVKEEITQNVNRLKYHPSVIIWCGNNENEWIWYRDNCGPVQDMQGFDFFHKILPQWINEIDTSRPYWPSSPFGDDEDPDSPLSGNRHVWDIWSSWIDYTDVRNDESLFVTEFGFQAPATMETFKTVLPKNVTNAQNEIFEFHNKQDDGNERLFRFLSAHLPVKTDLQSFIYLTQLNQGLALKTCLEHWRSRWPRTAGSIIWQINDCWPVSSWSLIDYCGRRKHSYYFTKHSFRNLLISVYDDQDQVWINVINDNPIEVNADLHIYLWDFQSQNGQEIKKINIAIAASNKSNVFQLSKNELLKKCLVVSVVNDNGEILSRNFYTPKKWKHVRLPEARYKLKLVSENTFSVKASHILFFLKIEHPEMEMEDLPEVILPGEIYEITTIPGGLNQIKLNEFDVKSLNNYLSEM